MRAERVLYDYGTFRVVDNGKSPMDGNDIIVQAKTPEGWHDLHSYNSLSDDYAYTNARDAAERRAKSNASPGL